jgi:DNA replication initiation complex subunit (GINS family)
MSKFNEIREKYHKEKNIPGLSDLPEDFYIRSLQDIKFLEEKIKTGFDGDVLREYESSMSMLKRLYWMRIQKIVIMALNSEEKPAGLLPEETVVYDKVKRDLEEAKFMFTCPVGKEKSTIKVQVLVDLPEFVGTDCRNYGPFSKDSVTELPKREAEILLKQNVVRSVVEKL